MVLVPRITPVQTGGQVDFSPISNAISENRLFGLKKQQMAQQQERHDETMGMQKERLGMQRQTFESAQRRQDVERAAGLAQTILENPDQNAASQQWQKLLASSPQYQEGVRELGLDPADYRAGAQALIAEARGFVDPLEQKTKVARLGLIQAQTAKAQRDPVVDPVAQQIQQARLKKLKQGNAMDEMINGMLSGAVPPQGQPGQPQLYNQSFEGAPQPNPGVQLTAGGAPQQQPQQAERMIQTPMGPMPESKARQLGFAMAMRGKGDAGRMFTDPITQQQLGKAATNENDKRQLNAVEQLSRLDDIGRTLDPRFLTIESKFKNYKNAWLDSFDATRSSMSDEDKAELGQFTAFRRNAVENINRYIKEITGAQMSEAEANRLRKAAPDAERDSPTQFMSKMKEAMRGSRLAIIRYNYLRKNGFQGDAAAAEQQMPLSQMGNIVNQVRQKALQQINAQNPDMPEDQKNEAAREMMRAELGISA